MMLIGRNRLLAEIHKAADAEPGAGSMQSAFDLSGSPGSGKTAIVRHLHEESPDFTTYRLDLEDYDPEHPGQIGALASVGAVQASFLQFRRMLEDLVASAAGGEVPEPFERAVTEAYQSGVANRGVFSFEEAMDEVRKKFTPTELADAWRTTANAVADSFVTEWKAVSDPRCRLILLDNIDDVADQELGVWVAALLPRLERTAVVVTRQADRSLPPFGQDGRDAFVAFDVPNFSDDEVFTYLDARAPGKITRDLASKVYAITGGHPGTIAIVYDLLWDPKFAGEDATRGRLLDDLPPEPRERVAELVERLVGPDKKSAMAAALDAAAVCRRFDSALLATLMNEGSSHVGEAGRVFEAFGQLPFVEDVTPPQQHPKRAVLRIHPYVRTGLLDRMIRNDKKQFERLNDRAAHYYMRLLDGSTPSAAYEYGDAFVYEDADWQRRMREWLYQWGIARDEVAQQSAVVESARLFLEAFWWWGNYVHFDFCDRLVADLQQVADRQPEPPKSKAFLLHNAARDFLDAYPPRSGKRSDADWAKVNLALLKIQETARIGSLEKRSELGNGTARKLGALIDVFLAHTWRYRDPRLPQADVYYESAQQGFGAVGEKGEGWSVAWVQFERADLRLESGDDGELQDFWTLAATSEPDEELAANLHRLRADVCWAGGDTRRAAEWYRGAVLQAYLFHNVETPPDEYTLQFYVDICARALNRLRELWKHDRHDDALAFAEELSRFLTETSPENAVFSRDEVDAALREGAWLAVARALFPRAPLVPELDKPESDFMNEFLLRRSALDMGSARLDLNDEQWP